MKKIITSLLTIGVLSAVVIGGTMSFFSDKETSIGNTFTAGTIDIAVDGENPWQGTFVWEDIKPGKDFEMSFEITNVGENPLKLWKIIKCMQYDDNGVIEPEQEWYDEFNSGNPKNDLDSAIVYEMEVDENMVVSREAGITMDQIKNNYIGLMKLDVGLATPQYGILEVGESVSVTQRYFMKLDTENWAQSDQMTFVIEIEARQTSAPEPLQQMMFMENKSGSAIIDNRMGVLKYDYMAPEFNYNFFATGLVDGDYQLIYYPDDWETSKQVVLIGNSITAVNSKIDTGDQSANLGMDLPNSVAGFDTNYPYGAKVWLVPSNSLSGTGTTLLWSYHPQFLFENWPGLINYKQGNRPSGEINCEYDDENDNDNPNCTDNDGDGYFVQTSGCENEPGFVGHNDCNDANPASWRIDSYYYDGDDDGYKVIGHPNQNAQGQFAICYGEDIPIGYTETNLPDDCDDNNANINPDVTEICDDGLDNDCDGNIDCNDNDCVNDSNCVDNSTQTIFFSDLNADPQYGYVHDYSNANVSFAYITPSDDTLSGVITAVGLKPYATYQMKFNGKPTCLDPVNGDDALNEIIGYQGRWWNNYTNSNLNWDLATNDVYYLANSIYYSGGECINGYLVWDYITADASGNVVKTIETANSYHVLWCGGGTCDLNNNNQLQSPTNPPVFPYCAPSDVNGEIERFTCDGLNLNSGSYDLQFVLNEESFHQNSFGTWTAVMDADINFEIN